MVDLRDAPATASCQLRTEGSVSPVRAGIHLRWQTAVEGGKTGACTPRSEISAEASGHMISAESRECSTCIPLAPLASRAGTVSIQLAAVGMQQPSRDYPLAQVQSTWVPRLAGGVEEGQASSSGRWSELTWVEVLCILLFCLAWVLLIAFVVYWFCWRKATCAALVQKARCCCCCCSCCFQMEPSVHPPATSGTRAEQWRRELYLASEEAEADLQRRLLAFDREDCGLRDSCAAPKRAADATAFAPNDRAGAKTTRGPSPRPGGHVRGSRSSDTASDDSGYLSAYISANHPREVECGSAGPHSWKAASSPPSQHRGRALETGRSAGLHALAKMEHAAFTERDIHENEASPIDSAAFHVGGDESESDGSTLGTRGNSLRDRGAVGSASSPGRAGATPSMPTQSLGRSSATSRRNADSIFLGGHLCDDDLEDSVALRPAPPERGAMMNAPYFPRAELSTRLATGPCNPPPITSAAPQRHEAAARTRSSSTSSSTSSIDLSLAPQRPRVAHSFVPQRRAAPTHAEDAGNPPHASHRTVIANPPVARAQASAPATMITRKPIEVAASDIANRYRTTTTNASSWQRGPNASAANGTSNRIAFEISPEERESLRLSRKWLGLHAVEGIDSL